MVRHFALLALGAALAGCSSLSIPGMGGSTPTVVVRAESNPAGAEARPQVGAPCRTPCTLEIPASGTSSITFSLQGYLPQTIPVTVVAVGAEDQLSDTGVVEQTRVDPNPVFATLELAPPPPPPPVRRKPAPRKPRPAPAAAQPAPPPPPPAQQGFGPPQQQQPGGFGPPQQPVYR